MLIPLTLAYVSVAEQPPVGSQEFRIQISEVDDAQKCLSHDCYHSLVLAQSIRNS